MLQAISCFGALVGRARVTLTVHFHPSWSFPAAPKLRRRPSLHPSGPHPRRAACTEQIEGQALAVWPMPLFATHPVVGCRQLTDQRRRCEHLGPPDLVPRAAASGRHLGKIGPGRKEKMHGRCECDNTNCQDSEQAWLVGAADLVAGAAASSSTLTRGTHNTCRTCA